MPTTATEWLADNPGDVAALDELMLGLADDVPIGIWTEMPQWMREEIAKELTVSFNQPYWEDIAKTTMGDAEKYLRQGLEEGWSIRRIASSMMESFMDPDDPNGTGQYAKMRSLRIARTESGRALNGARRLSMDRLMEDMGDAVPMRPEWLSVLGTTTRDSHASLDGVPADKDGMWMLAGYRIPYPSHYTLPASESIN